MTMDFFLALFPRVMPCRTVASSVLPGLSTRDTNQTPIHLYCFTANADNAEVIT